MANSQRWYAIKAYAGGPIEVDILDQIGEFGVRASDLITEIKA